MVSSVFVEGDGDGNVLASRSGDGGEAKSGILGRDRFADLGVGEEGIFRSKSERHVA